MPCEVSTYRRHAHIHIDAHTRTADTRRLDGAYTCTASHTDGSRASLLPRETHGGNERRVTAREGFSPSPPRLLLFQMCILSDLPFVAPAGTEPLPHIATPTARWRRHPSLPSLDLASAVSRKLPIDSNRPLLPLQRSRSLEKQACVSGGCQLARARFGGGEVK